MKILQYDFETVDLEVLREMIVRLLDAGMTPHVITEYLVPVFYYNSVKSTYRRMKNIRGRPKVYTSDLNKSEILSVIELLYSDYGDLIHLAAQSGVDINRLAIFLFDKESMEPFGFNVCATCGSHFVYLGEVLVFCSTCSTRKDVEQRIRNINYSRLLESSRRDELNWRKFNAQQRVSHTEKLIAASKLSLAIRLSADYTTDIVNNISNFSEAKHDIVKLYLKSNSEMLEVLQDNISKINELLPQAAPQSAEPETKH